MKPGSPISRDWCENVSRDRCENVEWFNSVIQKTSFWSNTIIYFKVQSNTDSWTLKIFALQGVLGNILLKADI